MAMAPYTGTGKSVLFGGYGPYGKLDDTWELEYSIDTGLFTWTMKSPALKPAARGHCAMAYDPISQKMVLYGEGIDTWLWDGINWTNAGASAGYLAGPAMVTDSGHGNIFMFGGNSGATYSSDIYEWTGTAWNKVSANTGPSGRSKAAMAYYPDIGQTVVFGGTNGSGPFADTWLWDGSNTWTPGPSTSGLGALYDASMAYDPGRKTLILSGGRRANGTLNAETWEFNGTAWGKIQYPAFNNGVSGGSAFLPDMLVKIGAFGGEDADGNFNNSVSLFIDQGGDGWVDWTPAVSDVPTPRKNHAMAGIMNAGGVALVGGTAPSGYVIDKDIAWMWSGGAWTPMSMPQTFTPRAQFGMALDSASSRVVLSGGKGTDGSLSDTWGWSGDNWVKWSGQAPTARYGHSLAFYGNTSGAEMILYGGFTTIYTSDTLGWQDGVGWQSKGVAGPPARDEYAMAYDAERGVLLLFGGYNNGLYYQDTWAWNGSSWTDKNPSTKPPARKGHMMVYDRYRKKIVMFGGYQIQSFPNYLNDTWEWNGTDWAGVTTVGNPGRRAYNSGAFEDARRRAVIFGGEEAGGNILGDTWEYHAFGGNCTGDGQCDTAHCVTGTCCEDASCNPGQCDITKICDPDTGHCKVTQYQPDTYDCSTGNLCSINDKCDGKGACVSGGTKPCSGDVCHDGYCDEADGNCKLKCITETDAQVCLRLQKDCGDMTAADCCGQQRSLNCGSCTNGYGCVSNVCTCESAKLCDVHCCGAATDVCFNNDCCTKETDQAFCTRLQKNCGDVTALDNCGIERTVTCGTCTNGYGCVANVCTCESAKLCDVHCCGSATDVCFNNDCCTKESNQAFCDSHQKNCGDLTATDNCGLERTANCGSCTNGYGCVANVCTCESAKLCDVHCCGSATDVCFNNDCCTKESNQAFCDSHQKNCDDFTANDNCDVERTTNCGTCTKGYGCVSNVCTCGSGKVCGGNCCGAPTDVCFLNDCCTKYDIAVVCAGKCGSVSDGCGGTYDCGGCSTCKNVCVSNVCDSTKHASTKCDGNDVYWYDSCDVKEDIKESCTAPDVCAAAECCTPETDQAFCARVGKQCGQFTGTDNCGGSRTANCGTCSTSNACDEASCGGDNMCQTAHRPDTAQCSTGDLCSVSDHCNGAGTCISGGPKVCTGDQCNDGYCDKADGVCKQKPNGTSTVCSTGNPCSVDDHCDGKGSCVSGGTKPSCLDGGTADSGLDAGKADAGTGDAGEPDGGEPAPGKGCSCSTVSL
jgi:hypothetical protein